MEVVDVVLVHALQLLIAQMFSELLEPLYVEQREQPLVLNQWLLSLFNVQRFEQLAEHLRNEKLEGLDENNVHHFHHALTAQLFNLTQLPTELLLEYDQNIVGHTLRLNDRRITRGEDPITWKYFQYLTLLFTEIY